ncbi:MAG TPA: DUF5916 domain-containing protein [Thermoanaerobaculia bacterium]|nr:DUF5916 domain-containing protein [Thermoanaerobaculia bacterium]
MRVNFLLPLFLGVSALAAPVTVPRCDAPPAIDGDLGDPCWSGAAVLDGFVQTRPGDNAPPSRETKVLLAYDTRALYVGIRAAEDPSALRATMARRDDVLADDYVQLHLDTFDDRRRAYVLIFNPLGVQQDGVHAEGRDVDYSVDVLMTSKGVVTPDGYTIEIEVPFSSLRHRIGNGRSWGVHVQRRIQHLDEDVSWMPLVRGNAALLAQAGRITGFEAVDTRRSLEVIPSVTVAESGARVGPRQFDTEPVDSDPGVTMKLALTPDVALDATVNPDFAQIEADQLVTTANQRFPIFFEEKRPFFLEGSDVFQTPLRAFHSRTIVDPDYAGKASGRYGRTGFGFLVARDRGGASAGVLRVRRDVGRESYLGVLATTREQNRLAGVDGRISLDARTVVSFQLLGTWSERKEGLGFFAEWRRTGRHLNVIVSGEGRTPGYRAGLGFTTQTDTNRWSVVTVYNSEPRPEAKLVSWTFTHTAFAQWDWDGRIKYAYVYPRVRFNLRRQTYAMVYLYSDYLRVFEEELGAAFAGDPDRSTVYKGVVLELGTSPTKQLSATLILGREWDNFDYDFGAPPRYARVSPAALADPDAPLDPGTGRAISVTGRVEVQPASALRVTLDYSRNRLVRDDTGLLAFDESLYSVQATHYFTTAWFARGRADYESLRSNVRGQLLLGWSPHPGTAVYAGYTDDLTRNGYSPFTGLREPGTHRNQRTVFVKLSYLVRRPL